MAIKGTYCGHFKEKGLQNPPISVKFGMEHPWAQFCVIIMEIIRIIFYSIINLDMGVWHMFIMNVTSHKHNRIIFLIILECRIEGRSILAINVNMY